MMVRRHVGAIVRVVTVAAVAWCVAGPSAAGVQDRTPYAAIRIVEHWRGIMNSVLEDSRAFAAEPVLEAMEIVVSPGAVRLIQDKAGEEQMRRADALVERFALDAVRNGQRQPDGSVIVPASAVETAEEALCPVYPFCE